MCGIYFSVSRHNYLPPTERLLDGLRSRGPDSYAKLCYQIFPSNAEGTVFLTFTSTVLSLRGKELVEQPLQSHQKQSVLCWNGEAWKIGGSPVNQNDAIEILNCLLDITSGNVYAQLSRVDKRRCIAQFFSTIDGPFSFVFFDAISSTVFYGRDALGRRSLLHRQLSDEGLILSSISGIDEDWSFTEVPPDGVFSIEISEGLDGLKSSRSRDVILDRWYNVSDPTSENSAQSGRWPLRSVSSLTSSTRNTYNQKVADLLICHALLAKSLHLRLRLVRDNLLSNALSDHQTPDCGNFQRAEKVAVLFSGGLDCTIVARLAHDIVATQQPIALVNVAFENLRTTKQQHYLNSIQKANTYEKCPDRITARKSLEELQRVCPGRIWKLITINIPYDESILHRGKIISLMKPHHSEMDISIAMALYFAARGEGFILEHGKEERYRTPARILLSGLGADELFGGYIRHEKAFRHRGVQGFVDELQIDIDRIGQRNLGRDDRVTSVWAKEVRYPFLDDDFVDWALSLPIDRKYAIAPLDNITCEKGAYPTEPGKFLLRQLALNLGLKYVSSEKKRAIQFGSRSAKLLDPKAKGSDSVIFHANGS